MSQHDDPAPSIARMTSFPRPAFASQSYLDQSPALATRCDRGKNTERLIQEIEALVEYNYEAQEQDELTIRKGDIIKDIKVSNGGWWVGTLRDKRGMFPDNFVKVLETPGGARNSAERIAKQEDVTLRNGSGRKYCKVLFSYEPCNDDELKLIPDESIEYLGEVEEGWWIGRIKGRTGVFPSNFVSSPVPEETERNKDKKELCRVLFPYEAANEDEITIVDGDIITLISRDAPDKGWWKGELNGQVGFFPDNFVEVIVVKNYQLPENLSGQVSTVKSAAKHQAGKRKETANVRKSLDTRNLRTDIALKKITSSSSTSSLSGSTVDKKPLNPLISNLKRLVGDSGNASSNNNGNGSAGVGLGEELDEVERGEGAPLSHLTASRAKAPRRRLPSTQHLRHHNVATNAPVLSSTNNAVIVLTEDNMTNGSLDVSEAVVKDDENDGLIAKSRRKAPWVEELKLNQMERRKLGTERTEKGEIRKDRILSWLPSSSNNADVAPKQDLDAEFAKFKEKEKEKEKEKPVRPEPSPSAEPPALSPSLNLPAYVPYHLYSQLLDRIAALEENQTVLQRKVNQLSEQLTLSLLNTTSDKN